MKTSAFIIWLFTIFGVLSLMNNYSSSAIYPEYKKNQSLIFNSKKPTIVAFLHPGCSCSKATAVELKNLLKSYPETFEVLVYFFKPSSFDLNWVDTDLWKEFATDSRVKRLIDEDGLVAKQHDIKVSGHILGFKNGTMNFSGGITNQRGHLGDSVGKRYLASIAENNEQSKYFKAPIFGCSLFKEAK